MNMITCEVVITALAMGSVSARFGIQLRARVGEENGCEGITTSKEEEQ